MGLEFSRKSLTLTCCSSIFRSPIGSARNQGLCPVGIVVRGVNKELGLIDQEARRILRVRLFGLLVRTEQILREFPSNIRVEELLRIVETLPEFADDPVRIVRDRL